ncbi:precorrin-8X methylmutase [Picrophilus oshimae DSM 9789]|uniref:Precorrin-8X methylmutase n=1 Tax=Picrophilus torridus (strain ATCC 700027 / DSM 9790 / JCM 10055 / NBRC 100828 / KAW 2/3) TaxID=1122961 RepID=Q6L326_PICTO|nr:precorrin-8X methylmutase [Picrophilus oshimae DSM 9789]
MVYALNPDEIYSKSFAIIKGIMKLDDSLKSKIIMRAAHATGDVETARSIIFSQNFEDGLFSPDDDIVTDINMVKYRISGYKIRCYIKDNDVMDMAKRLQISRSCIAMKKACREMPEAVYVIGDAPTVLISLIEEVIAKNAIRG